VRGLRLHVVAAGGQGGEDGFAILTGGGSVGAPSVSLAPARRTGLSI